MLLFCSILVLILINSNQINCDEINEDFIDKNGYIVFCPCMGTCLCYFRILKREINNFIKIRTIWKSSRSISWSIIFCERIIAYSCITTLG